MAVKLRLNLFYGIQVQPSTDFFKLVQKKNQAFCLHIKATFEPDFSLCKGGFDIPYGITNSKDEWVCISVTIIAIYGQMHILEL